MDAFFASVEQLDNPSLRGKPVLVGGTSNRGVVAAASYEARPFGARSAMPMAHALRLCPSAIVIHPRHNRYAEISRRVFEIFHRFTPLVEGLSLDEAFLDVTRSRSLFGDAALIALRIKDTVKSEIGLTASAGVAPNKFTAKIASDLRKPDGLVIVPPLEIAEFLAPLPLERMWGVGPKASERLRKAGLSTIGDLANASLDRLESLLGSALAAHVNDLAKGIDDRPVEPGRPAKSVGAEETFETDIRDRRVLDRKLLELSGRVARRLLKAGIAGEVVVVKLKYADFTLQTRRTKLRGPAVDTDSIYTTAKSLLDRFPLSGRAARLIGVAVADLTEDLPAEELSLFPDPTQKRRRLEEVVARVADRFGNKGLTRAALLEDEDGGRTDE
ncbi:MAG: DNA polymerase IV [Polyangiaceae bacterium]|nr:DNA polymerase IV [Polyangiaceae bacterium]